MILKKYKSQFLLAGILLIFIICKISELSLPYFWDELGVYARAALYLNDHHPGLLPSALPPELSRGHPLLFSFIYGTSFKLFGDGVFTGHMTSLCISLIFLICIYIITKKYFNALAGIYAVVFLAIQPVFYAQSVMVLPEILLALFFLLSIYFWMEKKYILFSIFSVCAMLTKETAVILPLVIMVGNILNSRLSKQSIKIKVKHILILAPWIFFGLFLLIQKQQNGWYLFPLHESNLDFDPRRFFIFLADYCSFIFLEQGRFIASIVFLLFMLLFIRRKITISLKPILIYLLLLILAGLLFSAINFYMNRYTLFVISALAILAGQMFAQLEKYNLLFRMILIPVLIAPFIFVNPGFDYDVSMNYKKYVDIQTNAVEYAVENLHAGDSLFANFPVIYCFRDSRFGYYDTTKIEFEIVRKSEISSAGYFMIADPGAFDHPMPPPEELLEVKRFQNEIANVKLLKLIPR